jgi:hypothetical protein
VGKSNFKGLSMTIYIVERWGINQQGCAGVFQDPRMAIEVARTNIRNEKDSWHSYYVTPWELNAASLVDDNSLPAPDPVYAIQWGNSHRRSKTSLFETFEGVVKEVAV